MKSKSPESTQSQEDESEQEFEITFRGAAMYIGGFALAATVAVGAVIAAETAENAERSSSDVARKLTESDAERLYPLSPNAIVERETAMDFGGDSEIRLNGETTPAAKLRSVERPTASVVGQASSRVEFDVTKNGKPVNVAEFNDANIGFDEDFSPIPLEGKKVDTFVIPLASGNGIYDIHVRSELAHVNPYDNALDENSTEFTRPEVIQVIVADGKVNVPETKALQGLNDQVTNSSMNDAL